MTAPRVKLYGLIPMTRRRYLGQLVVALVLSAGLLVGWWLYWPRVRASLEATRSDVLDRIIWFWDFAPWVIGGIVVLQVIEAWVVLRKFRAQEPRTK
jgi:hypothetical protein